MVKPSFSGTRVRLEGSQGRLQARANPSKFASTIGGVQIKAGLLSRHSDAIGNRFFARTDCSTQTPANSAPD